MPALSRWRMQVKLARRLRRWANRLDPTAGILGIAQRDIKAGSVVSTGDVLTHGTFVAKFPRGT